MQEDAQGLAVLLLRFADHLAAGTTGRCGPGDRTFGIFHRDRYGMYGDSGKPTGGHRQYGLFGADAKRVTGIFIIAAAEDFPVGQADGCTYLEPGVRRIGMFERRPGGIEQRLVIGRQFLRRAIYRVFRT